MEEGCGSVFPGQKEVDDSSHCGSRSLVNRNDRSFAHPTHRNDIVSIEIQNTLTFLVSYVSWLVHSRTCFALVMSLDVQLD